jgi:hypothetical protein
VLRTGKPLSVELGPGMILYSKLAAKSCSDSVRSYGQYRRWYPTTITRTFPVSDVMSLCISLTPFSLMHYSLFNNYRNPSIFREESTPKHLIATRNGTSIRLSSRYALESSHEIESVPNISFRLATTLQVAISSVKSMRTRLSISTRLCSRHVRWVL